MFKCLTCGVKITNEGALYKHIETDHFDSIPKNFSPSQYQYMLRTGKERGRCVECGAETKWNETTHKYIRMCGKQSCKDKARKRANKNMVGKFGVKTLLNDPDHQRKMLANRSISGEYNYGGTKIPYTGSYEKSFLKFLDLILGHPVEDLIAPSPNTYYYMYKGEKKFYIPDFYIPSLNLEIEVKDGGSNPNNHHKIQAVDKVKEKLKDDVMMSLKNTSYIKILDKNNYRYVDFLILARNSFDKHGEIKPIYLIDDGLLQSDDGKLIPRNAKIESVSESVIAAYHSDDVGIIESTINMLYENSNVFETSALRVTLEQHLESLYEKEYTVENNSIPDMDENMMFGLHESTSEEDGLSGKEYNEQSLSLIDEVSSEVDSSKEEGSKKSKEEFTKAVSESTDDNLYPVYVLLTNTGTFLSSLISISNNTEYAHSSISFDSSLSNLYSFGRKYASNPLIGRFVSEDIKKGLYANTADTAHYSLYVTFVSKEEQEAMKDRVDFFRKNKESFKYNFRGLLRFKMGRKSDNVNSYFCSQFVDSILREGGEFFEGKHSSQVQPEDFKFNHRFMLVSSGLLVNYDPKQGEKNTELLRKSFRSDKTPFKKPFVVYLPLDKYQPSIRTIFDMIKPPSKDRQDRVILTLPTNLKTLREIKNISAKDDIYQYERYTVIPITGDVDLIEYSEDSATVSVPMIFKLDNINIL